MRNILYRFKEAGKALSENYALGTLLLGAVTVALYIPGNSGRQASYDARQKAAMSLADTNHDGILSNDEVPDFFKHGGRLFIR